MKRTSQVIPRTPARGLKVSMPSIKKSYVSAKQSRLIAKATKKRKATSYTKTKVKKRRYRRKPLTSIGYYTGKFARKYKRVTEEERYLRNGYVVSTESSSTASDPDLVGVVHSTYSLTSYAVCLSKLLVRKILAKVGVNPVTAQESVPIQIGSTFTLEYVDQQNATQVVTHTIGSGDSMETIASTFYNLCVSAFAGSGVVRFRELHYATSTGIVLHRLPLEEMVLKLFARSVLKVQNRTQSESASNNADQVDNNPIHGYLVGCHGGIPQTRLGNDSAPIAIDSLDLYGVTNFVGSGLSSLDRQPFRRINFTNGAYEKSTVLQPGEIRNTNLYYRKSAYLNNFLKGFKVQTNNAQTVVRSAPGKSEVVMYEEMINTGALQNMLLAYEQEIFVCMDLIVGAKKAMRAEHRAA